jgi:hypothetical protein
VMLLERRQNAPRFGRCLHGGTWKSNQNLELRTQNPEPAR